MPFIFITSLLYTALVFVVPGFILLQVLADWISGYSGLPFGTLATLHVTLYLGLLGTLRYAWKSWNSRREADEEPPSWLWSLYRTINPRGFIWLCIVGVIGLGIASYNLATHNAITPSFWFLLPAVCLGLLDFRSVPDNLKYPEELGLPVPRFSFDNIPLEPGGGCRIVTLSWQPWPEEDSQEDPITHEIRILESEYAQARGRLRFPKQPRSEYARYVQLGLCESVKFVAAFIREYSIKKHFTTQQEINSVASMVRSIEYASDEETRDCPDWADFPVELLYDMKGDCEDHAILAAAILYWLGHEVGLFVLSLEDSGHLALACRAAAGVGTVSRTNRNGHQYFYVETVPTSAWNRVGNLPAQFQAELRNLELVEIGD